MKFAAIDIGSNAVRILFNNVFEKKGGPVFYKDCIYRVPVRLGEDAFIDGKISPQKEEDLVNSMRAFKLLMEIHKVKGYRGGATSAMREAENGAEIAQRIKKETGIEISIISGRTEARMIMNSEFGIKRQDDDQHYLYIDVGGGSTELVFLHKGVAHHSRSFRIGTLRLLNDQVSENRWNRMKEWLIDHMPKDAPITGIGSGGNINKMVKLYGGGNLELDYEVLCNANEYLQGLTLGERIRDLGLKPDRADVIVPASIIFRKVMGWAKVGRIIVPKFGIADGMIRELYADTIKEATH